MIKRILFFSVLVVFGILIFEGCKKDGSTVNPKKTPLREKIIGKWNLDREYSIYSHIDVDTITGDTVCCGNTNEYDNIYDSSFAYFYSDSTYLFDRHDNGGSSIGTWSLMPDDFDNEHLLLSYFGPWGPVEIIFHISTLTSSNFVLENKYDDEYILSNPNVVHYIHNVERVEMSK